VVDQAARGGDQDVQRRAQLLELQAVGHAADDGAYAQAGHEAAIVHRRLGDLHGEFTRRREHQDARTGDGAARRAGRLREASTRISAGSTKLAVLPLPVLLLTIRSCPARAGGMARVCTSVGAV